MRKVFAAIGVGLAVALGAALSPLSASAATATYTDLSGWTETAGGKAELVEDGVKLTTTENADKVDWAKTVNRLVTDVTTMQYETERLGGTNDTALPAYHVYLDLDADTDVDTTLIYEPYWQGGADCTVKMPPTGEHTWDVDQGCFWSSKTTGRFTAGQGGPPFYHWSDVISWYPEAKMVAYGIGQGSYNANTVARVNHVKFNAQINNWTLPAAPESPSPTPSESRSQSPSPTPSQTSESPQPTPSESNTTVPSPTPTATSADPTPSESSVVAAPPMNNSGSELPVTGSSKSTMLYLLGGGLMLVAIGGGAVLYARRNRDEVEFTS